MEEIVLSAKHRTVVGKQVKALRREGGLPAVLYGRSFEPIPITLNMHEASKILPAVTTSQLIIVELEGERHNALVRERQRHPVKGTLIHADFNVVSMTEKLRAYVRIHLSGEAPAATEFGGIVVSGIEEVEVECLPQYLIDRIEVDLSGLTEIGDSIHVRDLALPGEVDVLADPDEIVVVVTIPQAEEVEEVEEIEEEEFEPEVIERGRRDEEEEQEE